jgi:hypothetical protein
MRTLREGDVDLPAGVMVFNDIKTRRDVELLKRPIAELDDASPTKLSGSLPLRSASEEEAVYSDWMGALGAISSLCGDARNRSQQGRCRAARA